MKIIGRYIRKQTSNKIVKIERIKDLFGQDLCKFMLSLVVERGQCHKNAVLMCACLSNEEKKVKYVEGYLRDIGHCINSIERNGVTHYFDISQEWLIEKGLKESFTDEIEIVYEQFGKVIIQKVYKEKQSRFYKVKQWIFQDKRFYEVA